LNEFPDVRGLLCADPSDFRESPGVHGEDALDGAEVPEQSMREGWANSRQCLQQEEPARCEALRLPVESTQNLRW
jgi:hypothetical protein